MEWLLACLGGAKGCIGIDGELHPVETGVPFSAEAVPGSAFELRSTQGKLGDSEDSLLFCGLKLCPSQEDFSLSACLTVVDAPEVTGWQDGYGLAAFDTLVGDSARCRYRNMVLAGRQRLFDAKHHSCGLRAVSGHRDPKARGEEDHRCLDCSRVFSSGGLSPVIRAGEHLRLRLEKNEQGLCAAVISEAGEETLSIPGCDFLTVQEPNALYVGFAVAGRLCVRVTEWSYRVTPGSLSHTPEEALRLCLPDYPFPRMLLGGLYPRMRSLAAAELFAAPNGSESAAGTRENPLALESAVARAADGCRITLLDGVYRPALPLLIPEGAAALTLCAEHPSKAVIDGEALRLDAPILILRGRDCALRGLVFQNGPGPGLMVCGSGSRVDGCTACCNGDTGILICAFPGADRQQWPNNNLIINCDSFHNCDPARENADGFGAKLSVGEGNRFVGCIAHHNVDDGFDLYSKQILGPIGAVTIENCAAYANGRREPGMSEGAGSGFKLGGEGLAIPHSVCGCVAFGNALAGFSPNSNPAPRLSRLNAWDNGQGIPDSDYHLPSGRNHVQPDRCISLPPASPQTLSAALSRGPDGALDLEPLLAAPHLLFLTPHLSGGGAEKVIAELASRLALTYHVTLMTTLPDDGSLPYPVSPFVDCRSLPQEMEALRQAGTLPSRRQELPKPARRVLQVIFSLFVGKEKAAARFQLATGKEISERTAALAEWKRQFGIDCSISFLNSANYLNVKSCVGERTIISVRSYLAGSFAPPDCRSKEGRMRIAEACRLADCIVPVSVETGACLVERYGARPEKLHVILNGVDAQKLRAESKKEPRDTALAAAVDRAGFVSVTAGRQTAKKGQWHILRAFREVVKAHPDARLVILGRRGKGADDVSTLLQDVIRENALDGKVFIPGFFGNPYAILARCDAYVSASYNEGFPNALLEAMCLGLPVISTDCRSGPRELLAPETDCTEKTRSIEHASYGILVPECSGHLLCAEELEPEEQDMASAMLALAEDASLREHYIICGRERALQLSKKDIAAQWRQLIDNQEAEG